VRLADVLGVDLAAAGAAKLASAEERFLPEDYQGTAPVKS
jgi:hypothetical protein